MRSVAAERHAIRRPLTLRSIARASPCRTAKGWRPRPDRIEYDPTLRFGTGRDRERIGDLAARAPRPKAELHADRQRPINATQVHSRSEGRETPNRRSGAVVRDCRRNGAAAEQKRCARVGRKGAGRKSLRTAVGIGSARFAARPQAARRSTAARKAGDQFQKNGRAAACLAGLRSRNRRRFPGPSVWAGTGVVRHPCRGSRANKEDAGVDESARCGSIVVSASSFDVRDEALRPARRVT